DVMETRSQLISESKGKLVDAWRLNIYSHYWAFGVDRFQDTLEFIELKESVDDKLIAQSLALQLLGEDSCSQKLESLSLISNQFSELAERLNHLLNPVKSEEIIKQEEERAQWKFENDQRQREELEQRTEWIEQLRN